MSDLGNFPLNAYILCGGASQRMGRPKCNILYGNYSFVEHLGRILKPHVNGVFAVGKSDQFIDTTFPIILDTHHEQHPLWGVFAAMEHAGQNEVLIVACDLIGISIECIQILYGSKAPCYATSDRDRQPLLGIYPYSWLQHTQYCAQTNQSVFHWAETATQVQVPHTNLHNVNFPWECP